MESASGSEESEVDNASEEESSEVEEPETPSPDKVSVKNIDKPGFQSTLSRYHIHNETFLFQSKKRKRPAKASHNGNVAKKPVGAMGPPQTPSVKKRALSAFSASTNVSLVLCFQNKPTILVKMLVCLWVFSESC